MSVWIRRIAITLIVMTLVLAAAAAWLTSMFNPADHKGVAIEWVKKRFDRTLEVNGPVRLSLFPRLEVRLSGLTLSEAGRGEPFAALDEAALAVELLPLLRRRLAVDRIEAHGVRLVLLRDAKGQRNIDNLLQPAAGGSASAPALSFDVKRIVLSDVQARVKDELGGVDGELVLKELSTGRIASQVESGLQLVAQFGFKSPALKGELSGSTRFTPDLASGSLRLDNMSLAYKGDAPGASSIDALLKGMLDWDGAKSSLSAAGLNLRFTANAAGMRLVGSTLGVERFALDPAQRAFAIHQLKLRVKGTRSGSPLALDLDWPELDVSSDTITGSALAGKLSLGDKLPLSVTFKSAAPSGSFDTVRVPAFEARLSSAATERRIVGGLRGELVLQPEKRAAQLDQIDLNLRLDEPGWKPITLALKGVATATAGNALWSVAGDVNANAFSSEGSASLAGITPNVKTLVRFKSLDLNAMLEAPPSGSAAADLAPIDLAPLRSVNGSLNLRIGSLALRQYRAAEVALDATLDAGMLRVSSFRGQAWGGILEGSAFADARASRVALKGSAEGVNLPSVLKDMADEDLLDGTGRIDVDIETAGRTRAELKARLKGTASLQLRDGAVKGVNLARSLRTAKAALSLKQDALVRASRTERTDFSELTASFRIDRGVARSNDLALKGPLLRLAGDTSLDLTKGRLEGNLNTTLADTPKGQDGGELAALRGVALPLRLSGPVDDLQWKLEWSAAVASAVKNSARVEVEKRVRDRPLPRSTATVPAPVSAPVTAAMPAQVVAPALPGSAPATEDRLNNPLKGLP